MNTSRASRFLFLLLTSCLIFLCIACSSTATPPTSKSTSVPTVTPAQVDCPPATSLTRVEHVNMPPLETGNHPAIVYFNTESTNSQNCSILKRYDVTTGTTSDIAMLGNEGIFEAQISPDGQWILFIANIYHSSEFALQLIRMDGHYLQTLSTYNEASPAFEWSPNQQSLMFYSKWMVGTPDFQLWNLASGQKQAALIEHPPTLYRPLVWLDAQRIYVVDESINTNSSTPEHLYLLDTSKGLNQQASGLHFVTQLSTPSVWGLDISSNGSSVYISQCRCSGNSQQGPSSISLLPASGGNQRTIYKSTTLAITSVRAISDKSLLFLVENTSGDSSQNGLWKINADGTGLTRLIAEATGHTIAWNASNFFELAHRWSNVSRDGNMYAVEDIQQTNSSVSLLFGSLNGGTPTTFASFANEAQVSIVGWTTM